MSKFAEFGLRHEIAKRWTPLDWYKSRSVANRIETERADEVISNLILQGGPALVGRLGATEAKFLGEYIKINRIKFLKSVNFKFRHAWIKRSKEVNTNAGFYFKNSSEIEKFFNLYDQALCDTDVLGAWGTAFAWIESEYAKEIQTLIPIGHTAPAVRKYSRINEHTPWSTALDGMRVLVISPFQDTIKSQHKKTKHLFSNFDYPNFELSTIKAPLTFGYSPNSNLSWFERLDLMKTQMSDCSFDIALVSAGAYSFPLAHYAKTLGKIGIHAGGGLQLFFGIMGNRWEKSDYYAGTDRELWVRPSLSETPSNSENVEGSCYW